MDADAYNAQELAAGRVTARHVTALTREYQDVCDGALDLDGKCGRETRKLLDLANEETVLDIPDILGGEPPDQRDEPFGPFDGPLIRIPRTRAEIVRVFGDPGTKARPNKRWRKENIVTVRDLPGVPPRWYFKCHRLMEPYLREGLRRTDHVSGYVIHRAGGWVLRHIRHDPARMLSLHAYGLAVDFDAPQNRAKRFERGSCPRPWSEAWFDHWPLGVDQGFVEALESVGFTWGGCWGTSGEDFAARAAQVRFCDPMHFELRSR